MYFIFSDLQNPSHCCHSLSTYHSACEDSDLEHRDFSELLQFSYVKLMRIKWSNA